MNEQHEPNETNEKVSRGEPEFEPNGSLRFDADGGYLHTPCAVCKRDSVRQLVGVGGSIVRAYVYGFDVATAAILDRLAREDKYVMGAAFLNDVAEAHRTCCWRGIPLRLIGHAEMRDPAIHEHIERMFVDEGFELETTAGLQEREGAKDPHRLLLRGIRLRSGPRTKPRPTN